MDAETALDCNASAANFTGNSSSCPPSFPPPAAPMVNPYDEFFKFAFGSAIYITIVSFTTIAANGLLLATFFLDPLKMFRNATTYFLIGLAFVDIITAATNQPMYATCFIMMYIEHPDTRDTCLPLLGIGHTISIATWNVSSFIVLAFTITQYIVVISPLNHARKVTKSRVVICVLVIYMSSILVSVSPRMGAPFILNEILFMIMTYLNIAIYIFLHIAFKKKMAASKKIREDKNQMKVERNFVIVNFLLIAILFFCIQPTVVVTIVRYFYTADPTTLIASLFVDNAIYLKVLLDPFVYAWRIPKYRQALKIVLRCSREEAETKSALSDRVVARNKPSVCKSSLSA